MRGRNYRKALPVRRHAAARLECHAAERRLPNQWRSSVLVVHGRSWTRVSERLANTLQSGASPYDLQALVKREGLVRCDNGNVFYERLGNDLPVERVGVTRG